VLERVGQPNFPETDLWQNFRQSVVDFLLVADGIPTGSPDNHLGLYKTLVSLEKSAGAASVRKLAIALLETFDRDWNTANFNQKVLAINDKIKALSDRDLKEALSANQ